MAYRRRRSSRATGLSTVYLFQLKEVGQMVGRSVPPGGRDLGRISCRSPLDTDQRILFRHKDCDGDERRPRFTAERQALPRAAMTRLRRPRQPLRTYPLNKFDGLQWFRHAQSNDDLLVCRLNLLLLVLFSAALSVAYAYQRPRSSMALPPKTDRTGVERGGDGRPIVGVD